MTGYKLSLAG